MNIAIRRLTERDDLRRLEHLEAAVWSEASVIPLHMTLTLAKFGGLFLGAFDGDDMVGFLYSFPGFTDGEPHLCSHMLGFLPEYRKRGLGVRMKWMQRDEALRMGHRKITWTYDPLEAVNAYLNIAKLGGIVRRYLPNCYGEMNDDLNRGLPSDRFLVEWFLTSERVQERHQGAQSPRAVPAETASALAWNMRGGLPVPTEICPEAEGEWLQVAIPAFFQELKRADMGLAAEWRRVTGQLFPRCFDRGYTVTDVIRREGEPVVTYLLQKGADPA